MGGTLIIMPAYNAAGQIRKLLNKMEVYRDHLLVVDDGSVCNSSDNMLHWPLGRRVRETVLPPVLFQNARSPKHSAFIL